MARSPAEFADLVTRLRATPDDVRDHQGFMGLPQTGIVDGITASTVTHPYCGCTQSAIVQGGLARWERPQDIRYYLDIATLPAGANWRSVLRAAADAWEAVCGVKLTEVSTATAANVIVLGDRRDGASGVLADAELPYGKERTKALLLTFDNAENWTNGIDPYAVATHELGHILGFDHVDARNGTALMNPMYNPRVSKPTAVDVTIATKRYGAPIPKPAAPAPSAGEQTLVLTIKGSALDFEAKVDGQSYVLTRGN